uniref:Longin domain-containing protein n=1 Tax=Rhizophora mucronata TaxID=61149 RepID=A0A2P2JFC6_RHIMU
MGSIQNIVHYCCVSKGNRTLYLYSGKDREIERLAALVLENIPPYHKWYFETLRKKTFGFLMEDGCVYFTIVDEGLGSMSVLEFLEHLKEEFKKLAKKGLRGSFSGINSINVQEQLVPAIRHLITSFECMPQSDSNWNAKTSSSNNVSLCSSLTNVNEQIDVGSSTKAPLLGRSNKSEKKKSRDHVIPVRDIEVEEHKKSTDREVSITISDSNSQGGAAASPISLQKDLGSMRIRSSSQNIRKKWWRQVKIVLAIDAAICLILFLVWLSICGGFVCIH